MAILKQMFSSLQMSGILFKYEKKIEHVIHMFIIRCMQENYHSGNVIVCYLILGDMEMNKSVYSR